MRTASSLGVVAALIALVFVLSPPGADSQARGRADPAVAPPPAPPASPAASVAQQPAVAAAPVVVASVAGASAPPAALQITPATAQMEWCAAAGCTLTFTFSGPVPDARVVLTPKQAGKQVWRTPTTLDFIPAPGALLAGHEIAVAIPEVGFSEQLTVPYFEAAGKVARWPVRPGKPRFVALLNGFVAQLGRGALYALYDQPVDPAVIGRATRVTRSGKPIAVAVRRPASTAQIYDAPIALAHVVSLELAQLPPDGESVVVELPSIDDDGARSPQSKRLLVNTTLTASGFAEGSDDARKGRRTPLAAEWTVTFSNQVTSKQLERQLAIAPRPRALQVFVRGTRGMISAQLEPGVLYRLEIAGGLHDVLGNPLRAPVIASFRAQDLAPALALPAEPPVLERGHARLPVAVTNAGAATLTSHKLAAAAWLAGRAAGTPCPEHGGTTRPIDLESPLNRAAIREVALEHGLYCIAIAAAGRGSESTGVALAASSYVQITGVGLTAKVSDGQLFGWVTRLADGRPLAGARVALVDAAGAPLATATTAGDGTVRIASGGLADGHVVIGDGELVASLGDATLSHARQFGIAGQVAGADPLAAALFSERGVYRPGESVQLKAIVRDPDTMRPAAGELELTIADPRGEQVARSQLELDGFGGAPFALALKDDAAVGEYTVRAALAGRIAVRRFRVEEYRVPTFAVAVSTDEDWRIGAAAHAAIDASYLHGGALAGRDVKWGISRRPEPFAPPAWQGYTFDAAMTDEPRAAESLSHGAGKLDGRGRLIVAVTPDHGSRSGPMRYVVDAAVTDVDRQVYAGKLVRVVHPADVYLGLAAPARRVVAAGDTLSVPIIAVAGDGGARPGVAVTATLERIDHHGATRIAGGGSQRIQRPIATVVRRCAVTSAARPVDCRFAIRDAGEYVVRASAADSRGRPVEAAFRLAASGGTTAAWPRFDHERIRLVADKPSYRPGEVARLIIQSPFPDARGLLTIERAGVIEHRLFDIAGDTPELRVPIRDGYLPGVYASVVLVRGRVHDAVDATGFPTGAPAFRMGYAELRVEPRAHRLDVEVVPAAPKAFPGSTLAIDLAVRDADGKPRPGQATVMVVDEAVLGLTRFRTPDPLAELFVAQPLAVRTGESRLDLLHARRSRREQVFPSGDGGSLEPAPAPLDELPPDLRRLFRSTAYYNPDVRLGPDGRARVEVALPDNVTTYRIMAIAVDAETRAGAGQASVLVRKPVLVQPVLPRFVRPGDRLKLEARVFNASDSAGTVELTAAFLGAARPPVSAPITAGGEARLSFPVELPAEARGSAKVRFAARLGAFSDAVEVELPIVDPGTRRKLVASKQINGTDTLTLALPADRRAGSARLELVVSGSPLSELKDSVDYLLEYPNGCIEQTTSTAYPLVVLDELLPKIGVTVDPGKLRKLSEAGVKRILSFQTRSGGLSYWPGSDEPHAFATAFGLTALIEGKRKGHDVPDAALARMADYLETALRQGKITEEMPHAAMADADTRALFVMTLGRLGRPQAAYVSTLWDHRDRLTAFGLGFLAVAISEGAGDRALLAPVLAAVKAAAKELPREAYYDGAAKGGWSFDSPLRTHGSALLAYAAAGTGAPDPALAGKLLTGLLARRTAGLWGNTQENVFGIMAVARLAGAGASDPPEVTVRINGKPYTSRDATRGGVNGPASPGQGGRASPPAIDPGQLRDTGGGARRLTLSGAELEAAGTLVIEVTSHGRPVFATARLDYVAKLDAVRAATSAGFTVTRRYETLAGAPLGARIPLGALVRVRLRVDATAARHYVAIDDKLPAGLEPLNAALATSETVAAGKPTAELRRALDRLSYSELRDARVAFYLDDMPAGSYELTYVARATTPGTFIRPAALAEAMYEASATGTSAIDEVTIE